MKKSFKNYGIIIVAVIIAIVAVIITLNYLNARGNVISEAEARCIAERSKLYISRTCGHCANQKEILGDYLVYFDMTDCVAEQQRCIDDGIKGYPTWVIDGEHYLGVRPFSNLKEITGC